MKTASDYKTPAAVLAAPELAGPFLAFERGRIIDEIRARQANEPPPPPPVPDAAERAQLTALKKSLEAAGDEWRMLEVSEKKFSELLPVALANLKTTEAATQPDATQDQITALLVEQKRVDLMRAFLTNLEPRRRDLQQRIVGALHAVNTVLERGRFSGEKFYLSGISPAPSIRAALACIETLLKK